MRPIRISCAYGAVIAVVALVVTTISAQRPPAAEIRGASWFNGRSFEAHTKYVVAGRLTRQRPSGISETIDASAIRLKCMRPSHSAPCPSISRGQPATNRVTTGVAGAAPGFAFGCASMCPSISMRSRSRGGTLRAQTRQAYRRRPLGLPKRHRVHHMA